MQCTTVNDTNGLVALFLSATAYIKKKKNLNLTLSWQVSGTQCDSLKTKDRIKFFEKR